MNKQEAREQLMSNSSDCSSGSGELQKSSSASSNLARPYNNDATAVPAASLSKKKQQRRAAAAVAVEAMKQKPAETTLDMPIRGDNNTSNPRSATAGGGDRNNSSSNLKKLHGDLENMTTASSTDSVTNNKKRCSKATICLLIFSMSLIFILAAITLAILKFDLLDREDLCHDSNQLFNDNKFKLFTTKTTYNTAFEHIHNEQNEVELPSVFNKRETLKSINERLTTAPNNCKVRQLHYYGRHAARFPDKEDIEELNKAVQSIQKLIDLQKSSSLDAKQAEQSSDSVTIVGSDSANTIPQYVQNCTDPLAKYKEWVSFMRPDQDNLVTESGYRETYAIADRLKELFPQMFDAAHSDIKFYTTAAIRTAQTAVPFIKHLDNFKFSDACPSGDSFPSKNLSSSEAINSNSCLKDLIKASESESLSMHKTCEALVKKTKTFGLKLPSSYFKSIASHVSKGLKLTESAYLTPSDAKKLYDICKYETAHLGSSIWCNLFEERHLRFYEYFDDVEDFYKDAYGDSNLARSACPITVELVEALDNASRNASTPQTHLHFTHSQVIRKLIAASFDLSADEAYDEAVVLSHLTEGSSPDRRQWRTSLFTPFSANLLFTLYECPTGISQDGLKEIRVNRAPFKVVVSLNEQPVHMDKCEGVTCGLDSFVASRFGNLIRKGQCDLQEFCNTKFKMSIEP